MASNQKTYRPETRLVHGGTLRSQFGETSEALFLTQGYVCLLYTSPSPRDGATSRMPSSA